MTGSIVALFVEWKVYERACERSIESVMKIQLLELRYSSYFIDTLILNSKSYFNPKLDFVVIISKSMSFILIVCDKFI